MTTTSGASAARSTHNHATDEKTPAQLYALTFGAVLLLAGLLGFIVDSSFENGDNLRGDELVVFLVNGWHNLVHILSGLLGLALYRRADTARAYALGFGFVYLIVTIWGFADGNDVLSILPVNTADNFLHLAIAALGIAAGLVSSSDRRDGKLATSR